MGSFEDAVRAEQESRLKRESAIAKEAVRKEQDAVERAKRDQDFDKALHTFLERARTAGFPGLSKRRWIGPRKGFISRRYQQLEDDAWILKEFPLVESDYSTRMLYLYPDGRLANSGNEEPASMMPGRGAYITDLARLLVKCGLDLA